MIETLLDLLDDVRAHLDPARRGRLDELLAGLVAADDPDEVALDIADLVEFALPPGHSFLAAIPRGGARLAGGSRADWSGVLARLAASASSSSDVGEVVRAVHERLLAAPAYPDARADGEVLRLERPDGGVQVPAFQFEGPGRLWPVVHTVNRILGADDDPWGVADWWLGPNAWLDSVPADLLGRARDDDLIAAARAVSEED